MLRVFVALVDTKFNWALDPPLSITKGVAAEAVMMKPRVWSVSPIFKMPTVWVALSVTVVAFAMLFVKFAVAEVPLAVMLPDQFVAVVQLPFTVDVQDPSAARKHGVNARVIATQRARAILGSLQICVVVFFIVQRGRDSRLLVFYGREGCIFELFNLLQLCSIIEL